MPVVGVEHPVQDGLHLSLREHTTAEGRPVTGWGSTMCSMAVLWLLLPAQGVLAKLARETQALVAWQWSCTATTAADVHLR